MPKGSWLEYAVSPQEERVVGDGWTGAGQAKGGQLEQLPTSLAPCHEHVHCCVAQAVTPRLAMFLSLSPPLTATLVGQLFKHEIPPQGDSRPSGSMRRTESSLRCCCPPKRSDASKCRRTSPANGANLGMGHGARAGLAGRRARGMG